MLAGNISVASGNRLDFQSVGSGTFTLSGSNSFGADLFTTGSVTFRISGSNAAGGVTWRPGADARIILLDGANFRSIIGNPIGLLGMESSGTAVFSGDVAGGTLSTPAGALLTMNGVMRGSGSVVNKLGAGTVVIPFTFNDPLKYVLQEGTLQIPVFSALGWMSDASYIVLNGGMLRYTGGAASTDKQFTLGASGGSLDASGSGAATFTSGSAIAFTGSGSRTLTLTGANTGSNQLAAAIGDNGSDVVSLAKAGAGTWVLSGSNTYTGATTINGGVLALGTSSALAGGGNLSFGGGTLRFSAANTVDYSDRIKSSGSAVSIDTNSQSVTFASAVDSTNTGGLAKLGSGTLTLSGSNGYTGSTRSGAGTLAIGNASALAASTLDMNSADSGSVTFSQDSTIGGMTGSRNLDMGTRKLSVGNNNQSTTYSGVLSNGGLTKLGSGTLTLSGSSSYTGATSVNGGVLALGTSTALAGGGNLSFGGGTLQFSAANTVDYSGRIKSSGSSVSIDTNSQSVTFGSSIDSTNTGGLTKLGAGTLTLSGSNSYTGSTRVGSGTLVVGNASALAASTLDMNSADSGGVTFSQNSTLGGLSGSRNLDMGTRTLSIGNNNQSTTYSGGLSSGALTKIGTGALTLSGSNSYTGATRVAAGSLLVNGTLGATAVTVESGGLLGGSGVIGGSVSVFAGGTFSPGNSPGLLTSGPLSLAGTSLMEIDGLAPRGGIGGYDATDVTGLLTYGGSMLIDFGSGITSAFDNNTTFNLFDFTSWTGSFTSITTANDGSFYAGLTFTNSGNNDRWTATKGTQTLEFTHSTGNLVIVPEPHAAVLAGCGVAAAAWGLSRRRRRGTNA